MTDMPEKRSGKRDLSSGSLLANLLHLGVPLATGMVLNAFYQLVDAFWLGKWSKHALAAPGVSMPFIFFVISFAMGFGSAGTALVAQFTGAKRYAQADRAAGQVMLVLCALVVGFAAPIAILASGILRLFNVPPEMLAQGSIYLSIFMTGLPVLAFTIAYGAVLRALGDTITVVIIHAAANVLNMGLDPLLIFGWGRIPPMGVGGAAVATVASQFAAALACYALLCRGHAGLHVKLADFRPDWGIIRRIFSVGLPAAVGNSSNSLGFAMFQLMINTLGTTVIAAFTIGFRLIHFFHVPSRAFAMAAAPIVGQALGAGKPQLARRAVKLSAAIIATGMLLPVVFLMWQGQLIARFFTDDAGVVVETGKFFLIVPASSYTFGMIMVLSAAFYGSGHTWPVMALSILRLWVIRLPVAWALGFALGWGSLGVYGGMVVGNVVTALAALMLFRVVKWQKAVVATAEDEMEEVAAEEP